MNASSVKGLILLLGSPNSENGELYSIAKDRCELAFHEYKNNRDYKILLTGGYGSHFNTTTNPHACYLKEHLKSKGIPEENFTEFAESKNTLEDAALSKPIVLKYDVKQIIIITSDYHYARAKFVFENEYSDVDINIQFSISKTDKTHCEIDLFSLKKHEIKALNKLKLDNYFKQHS